MLIEDGDIILVKNVVEKRIKFEDFVKEVAERNNFWETKQLPVNCVKYERTDKIDRYFIHIPEDNYKFNYNGSLYVVRFPHTIFIFTFNRDSVSQNKEPYMIWCDDEELDLDSTNFFVPPLHNIYDSGKVCTGTSVSGVIDQRSYVNEYLKNFFTTEFNDDLSTGKRTLKNVSKDQHEYIKKVTNRHDLVQLWWKKLIHEHGVYVLSKPVLSLNRRGINSWISN